jgi:crotonobetainyl-CoA:carnitine CoA-transferase CaiB-like acyl-CoA transferase
MGNIMVLRDLLGCEGLSPYTNSADWFDKRDEIKTILATHLSEKSTKHWLSILEPADIWCAKVMDYDTLMQEEGYKILEMELNVKTSNGLTIKTTRCPIRIDGEMFLSDIGAPLLGEHNAEIERQFDVSYQL